MYVLDDEIGVTPKGLVVTDIQLDTRTSSYSLNGKKSLVDLRPIVKSFPSGIEAGDYSFPFEIQLPTNGLLPSTFISMKDCKDVYKGAVIYKVAARLGDLYCGMLVPITPNIIREQVTDFKEKKFLFGGIGKLKMKLEMEKNFFQPCEVIPIKLSIQNDSRKDVQSLKVKLFRTATISFDEAALKITTYGETNDKEGRRTIKQGPVEVYRMKFEGVSAKTHTERVLNFFIPRKTLPSTNGTFLKIEYYLDVECDVPFAFDLESKPSIEIVYQPKIFQNIPFFKRLPDSWKSLFI